MSIPDVENILQSCQSILSKVREKSKVEVNALLIRIQYLIEEMQKHLQAITSETIDIHRQKYHWSVLYSVGDILDEMATLIHNTTPVTIQTEVDYIKQSLVFYTDHVVQTFGKRESMFIIPPKFQELADLW